jgi:hypothetical protein
MGWAEVLQGVRRMRFEALLARHESGEPSLAEAGEMPGESGEDSSRDDAGEEVVIPRGHLTA